MHCWPILAFAPKWHLGTCRNTSTPHGLFDHLKWLVSRILNSFFLHCLDIHLNIPPDVKGPFWDKNILWPSMAHKFKWQLWTFCDYDIVLPSGRRVLQDNASSTRRRSTPITCHNTSLEAGMHCVNTTWTKFFWQIHVSLIMEFPIDFGLSALIWAMFLMLRLLLIIPALKWCSISSSVAWPTKI